MAGVPALPSFSTAGAGAGEAGRAGSGERKARGRRLRGAGGGGGEGRRAGREEEEEEEAGAVSHAAPGGQPRRLRGRGETLAGRGFNGAGPSDQVETSPEPFRQPGNAGELSAAPGLRRRRRRRRPDPEPRCRSDWGRGGRAQAPGERPEAAEPRPGGMAAGAGSTRGQRAPGAGRSARAPGSGPESPRPARAWRARGPDAGSGRRARTTHRGKKKKKKGPFIAPEAAAWWRPPRFPARPASGRPGGLASGPRGQSGARASPLSRRRPHPTSTKEVPEPAPSFPRPPGDHRSPSVACPDSCSQVKYWACAPEEPQVSLLSGSLPRGSGSPARIVATVQGAIIG